MQRCKHIFFLREQLPATLSFELTACGDTHMTVHLALFSSLAQSISVSSLAIRPFLVHQRARVITQATPAKSAN